MIFENNFHPIFILSLALTKMPYLNQMTIEQAREDIECWSLNYQEITGYGYNLEDYIEENKESRPRIRWYLQKVYQAAYEAWMQFPHLEKPKNLF